MRPTVLRLNQKLLKQITEPDGSLRRYGDLSLLDPDVYNFRDTATQHPARFGYDYSKDNSRRLAIYGINTDTSRGRDWRAVLFSWPSKPSSAKDMRAYYITAGGGGYDFLASATRGVAVYDNDDNVIKLGDHCDPDNRPTLETFVIQQGWYAVTW